MASAITAPSDTLLIPNANLLDFIMKRTGNLNRGPKTGKR